MKKDIKGLVAETEEKVRKYTSKTIEDIINNPAPETEAIMDKGILVVGSRACIYAAPKVGKSLLAIQLGLCLASGTPFLDISILRPCNVLYLNFELDDHRLEQRILEIKERLQLGAVPRFRKLTLLGTDVPLLDTDDGVKAVRSILDLHRDGDGFPVDVLIWDCRYKNCQRSENEDDIMKLWCRNMEQLAKEYGFVPVIVHHQGKRTTGVGAGSSVFDRWINTAIHVEPLWSRGLDHSPERRILIDGSYTPGCRRYAVLDYPIHRIGGAEAWQEPPSKKDQAEELILQCLEEHGGKMEQEELQRIVKGQGCGRSTFSKALNALKQEKRIYSKQDPTKQGRHNVVALVVSPSPELDTFILLNV